MWDCCKRCFCCYHKEERYNKLTNCTLAMQMLELLLLAPLCFEVLVSTIEFPANKIRITAKHFHSILLPLMQPKRKNVVGKRGIKRKLFWIVTSAFNNCFVRDCWNKLIFLEIAHGFGPDDKMEKTNKFLFDSYRISRYFVELWKFAMLHKFLTSKYTSALKQRMNLRTIAIVVFCCQEWNCALKLCYTIVASVYFTVHTLYYFSSCPKYCIVQLRRHENWFHSFETKLFIKGRHCCQGKTPYNTLK